LEAGALAWADAGNPVEIAEALRAAISDANMVGYLFIYLFKYKLY
jgi:hypothetical protein